LSALLIGGKIWGMPGMILAIPATGILKIVLPYSSRFKASCQPDRRQAKPMLK